MRTKQFKYSLGDNIQATIVQIETNYHLLHVVPVGDDAVLDGILQGEDTSLALGLVSDVRVLLSHTDHHALVAGATHDGREDGTGRIVAGETGFAHAGAVVDYQRSNIVVTHFAKDRSTREQRERVSSASRSFEHRTGGAFKVQPVYHPGAATPRHDRVGFLPKKVISRSRCNLIGRSPATGRCSARQFGPIRL